MSQHNDHKKAWVAAAVSTAVLLFLLRQRRQKRKAARQSAADATRAALQKAMQRSLVPVFVQAEALPTGWGVAPPVFYPPHCAVIPLVLPSEMEEIERSSHLVRKVSVSANVKSDRAGEEAAAGGTVLAAATAPTPAAAFILCTHTGAVASTTAEEDPLAVLARLLAHHPVLQEQFAGLESQWAALDAPAAAPSTTPSATPSKTEPASSADASDCAVAPVFTHVLRGKDNCVLLGGVNGPYFVVAVLTGFTNPQSSSESSRTPTKLSDSTRSTAAAASAEAVMDLESVIRGVRQAALKVPLPAAVNSGKDALATVPVAARLPGGAAFAVHRGYYRVLCVRDGRELELCVPPELSVRSDLVNLSLVTPAGSPVSAKGGRSSDAVDGAATAQDTLLSLAYTPSAYTAEERVEAQVTEEVFAALAEKPQDAAATLWAATGSAAERANTSAEAAFRAVTARPLTATTHARSNMVTMVYVQPKFGVLFSVHPLTSVVYEPWMTELPTLLYYPLGESVESGSHGGSNNHQNDSDDDAVAPPVMSIEYVLELPSTWEVLAKDEEELVHNVLFHFTNWEAATVSSSMVEISGIRCVMFHEERGGRRCRTYILPRGSTVLIVRWETSVETWDKYLPVFQQTLDTLHVDAAAITK